MLVALVACRYTIPEPVFDAPDPVFNPDLDEPGPQVEQFAEHEPLAIDLVVIVDPAAADDPDLQVLVSALAAPALPALRIAIAPMVQGAVPEWTTDPDWDALGAATGSLAAYDVAVATPDLDPDASRQVLFATSGAPDASVTTLAEFAAWLEGDRDTRLSAAHVAGPGELADAAEATGGTAGPARELDGWDLLATEWGYPLADRPVLSSLDVQVTSGGYRVGLVPYDRRTGTGDFTYDEVSNSVELLAYVPDEGAVLTVTYEPVVP
jgi:hypothetical protein